MKCEIKLVLLEQMVLRVTASSTQSPYLACSHLEGFHRTLCSTAMMPPTSAVVVVDLRVEASTELSESVDIDVRWLTRPDLPSTGGVGAYS